MVDLFGSCWPTNHSCFADPLSASATTCSGPLHAGSLALPFPCAPCAPLHPAGRSCTALWPVWASDQAASILGRLLTRVRLAGGKESVRSKSIRQVFQRSETETGTFPDSSACPAYAGCCVLHAQNGCRVLRGHGAFGHFLTLSGHPWPLPARVRTSHIPQKLMSRAVRQMAM